MRPILTPLLLMAGLAAAAPAAHALVEGRTAQGRAFVTGGIGEGEREALAPLRDDVSLRLTVAAKGSGAYLAGTRVRITDRRGATVLDTALDGPWLLVELEGGDYRVAATHRGQTIERRTTVAAGAPRGMVIYFDVDAERVPEGQKP